MPGDHSDNDAGRPSVTVSETVAADGVRLALTDHGGPGDGGRTIVLLPGLGLSRTSLDQLAGQLGDRGWRVVTADNRGHGESGTGPWTFDAAVADLHAVVAALGLTAPYVGGHSLGGMVALRYAIAGHPTAGVVNVDGWGPGVESRLDGVDPARATALLDRIAEGRMSWFADRVVARTRVGREGTMLAAMRELRGADVVAWHRDAPCPSLALHAVAAPLLVNRLLMGREVVDLQAHHHRGLTRDLAEVAAERDDVTVVEVDATHALFRTHAELVADEITQWSARLARA
jgi:pimeloyl-ACP methyl ester carboxylesterase